MKAPTVISEFGDKRTFHIGVRLASVPATHRRAVRTAFSRARMDIAALGKNHHLRVTTSFHGGPPQRKCRLESGLNQRDVAEFPFLSM